MIIAWTQYNQSMNWWNLIGQMEDKYSYDKYMRSIEGSNWT